jgi:hypothetical protein
VASCLARLQPFQRFRASMKPRAIQGVVWDRSLPVS